MKKFIKLSLFLVVTLLLSTTSKSQDNAEKDTTATKLKLTLGADIMSRYIWRGSDYGNSLCIQPTLAISAANFEIGCWSSVGTNNFYKEVDLYAKYTIKNFSLVFTDYYVPLINDIAASPDNRYFIYDDKNTAHSFEGSLLFKGGEKFPLWLLGGVFFYGNDKRWGYDADKDSNDLTYYSSYFEAGYSFTVQENSADLFIGFTPSAGAYGNTLGVVNLGVTATRKLKISNTLELPVKGSLIFNPQTSNVFFVFGITI